jgi:hypothetical protein
MQQRWNVKDPLDLEASRKCARGLWPMRESPQVLTNAVTDICVLVGTSLESIRPHLICLDLDSLGGYACAATVTGRVN